MTNRGLLLQTGERYLALTFSTVTASPSVATTTTTF